MDIKTLAMKFVDLPWGKVARSAKILILTLAILLPLTILFLVYYYRIDVPETTAGQVKNLLQRDAAIDGFTQNLREFAPEVRVRPQDFTKKSIFE